MNFDRKYLGVFLLLVFVTFAGVGNGLSYSPNVESVTIQLDSKLMGRKMPINVTGPAGFTKNKSSKLRTVYLLHGLTGSYSGWKKFGGVGRLATKYNLLVVMPEGENGWYVDSQTNQNGKYESYIIKELIPRIEKDFPAATTRGRRAIAGLSMGGYGGIKFGLKYPEMFSVAGSFSGALRAPEWDAKTVPGWKVLGESIMTAFGPMASDTREANDIYKLANSFSKEDIKTLPFIYLDCGTEDPLVVQAREFSGVLMKKRIKHEFRQLPGGHSWRYWAQQIMEFGALVDKKLSKTVKQKAKGN